MFYLWKKIVSFFSSDFAKEELTKEELDYLDRLCRIVAEARVLRHKLDEVISNLD